MTLNTAFINVFGEQLAQSGFKLIKNEKRHPFFVRHLSESGILHIITVAKVPGRSKEFCINSGVVTVHCGRINLLTDPYQAEYLDHMYSICGTAYNFLDVDKKLAYEGLHNISYSFYDTDIILVLKEALKITACIVIPILDKVNTLKECVNFYIQFKEYLRQSITAEYKNKDFVIKYPKDEASEGLIWLIINDRDFYISSCELWKQLQIETEKLCNKSSWFASSKVNIDEFAADISDKVAERIRKYDEIFSDSEWLEKAHKELERRKASNLDVLRSYSILE
jgi:hypothetical protein